MADNFNLRSFLTENKLTKNAQLLKESYFDDLIDAVGDYFDEGTPEYEQLAQAVEAAIDAGEIDYSDFSHSPSSPSKQVGAIGREIGLFEEKKEKAERETMQETKLTAKERKLVKLVENALGISEEEMTPEEYQDKGMPFKEEIVDEQPLPKYENIEKLMQEIEAGTNEAAHSYKMKRMKEIAEMLEAKVGSLEEGEGADFVDAKKVKQMKKDIMTLRKQAEKLEKEYDKKFAKKQDKKETVKESKMENFDLKKFLVENKITTNSRMLKENSDMGEKMQFFMEFMGQYAAGMPEEEVLEVLEGSYDIPEDVDMQILKRATSELDLVINDIYTAVFESDNY
jgi:hypothetical protein